MPPEDRGIQHRHHHHRAAPSNGGWNNGSVIPIPWNSMKNKTECKARWTRD